MREPAILMRKDMAKRWNAELVEATANIVKVNITVNEGGNHYFLKSVYIPPRQSKAKADMSMLECDNNSTMGGDISWKPQRYMHINVVATEDPDKVSENVGMIYNTYEERSSARDESI